ncbi:ABC transporter substrate-binding protein [Aliicoccus persicus]|uniref:Iron(III) transport system substrate-binding protein n=1 Tax=Aliicoccus persicus TaxID=930138 RepID=A0A662Z6C1_9STAP|nr:ABC transporter substrate-binding protein [Aliicoccus persicus]SEW15036.1 iron(III) transport system substrate-binding protein [Aliicoccus persicus]
MKLYKLFGTVLAGAALTFVASTAVTSDNNVSAQEDLEGTVEFYTSQPDADASALVEAFNEVYPNVEVNIFRSGTEEVIGKINAERQAGDIQADVLLVADSVTFEALAEDDLLLSYESTELEGIPEEFIAEDFLYYGTKVMATVIAYNTDNVEEAPTSWEALVSEDAAGSVVMPSPSYSGAAAYNAGVFTRNDFGWEFYEDLFENDTMVVQGNGGALQEVVGGNKDYAMVVDFITANAKAEGAPVELVYPEEGVPVITEPIGIMADTENEEASKAFVDFVLSVEGQEFAQSLGYTPIKEGVEAPEGLLTIDEIDVLEADLQELVEGREDDVSTFQDIFGE